MAKPKRKPIPREVLREQFKSKWDELVKTAEYGPYECYWFDDVTMVIATEEPSPEESNPSWIHAWGISDCGEKILITWVIEDHELEPDWEKPVEISD